MDYDGSLCGQGCNKIERAPTNLFYVQSIKSQAPEALGQVTKCQLISMQTGRNKIGAHYKTAPRLYIVSHLLIESLPPPRLSSSARLHIVSYISVTK